MDELVRMHLSRVIIQEKDDSQYIHLQEQDGDRSFPIVIGFNEAAEINRKLRSFTAPRPMTHDLIGSILRTLEWELQRVVVTDLKQGTFFAKLVIARNGEAREIDCRPSDAIALAVQLGCPIFVARKVLDLV
jgi:hypothetical protein